MQTETIFSACQTPFLLAKSPQDPKGQISDQ